MLLESIPCSRCNNSPWVAPSFISNTVISPAFANSIANIISSGSQGRFLAMANRADVVRSNVRNIFSFGVLLSR